jgi:hypothetical protein
MSENHRPFPVYPERQPIFSGLTWNSQYVTVRDGTRLVYQLSLCKADTGALWNHDRR